MNEHLVLSSGYFNVTGGRRQDSADTFRVLPSMQTRSGEEAALYAVSEASTPGPMGARARRMVIDVIQGEYSSAFDLPPGQRLRRSVEAAHRELYNEFKGHVRVGLTVLVAEGPSLYLAQVAPAQAYVLHRGNIHSVATAPQSPESAFANALGSSEPDEPSLFRDTMEASDVVLLCSSWFSDHIDPQELRFGFSADGPDEITRRLFEQIRGRGARDVTCIALQALRYDPQRLEAEGALGTEGPTLLDHRDEAVSAVSFIWHRVVSELRPSDAPSLYVAKNRADAAADRQPSALPVASVAVSDSAAGPLAGEAEAPGHHWRPSESPEHSTEELPILQPTIEDMEGIPPEPRRREPDYPGHKPERPAFTSMDREAQMEEVNSFIETTLDIGKSAPPPVQAFPDPTVTPERINPSQQTNRRSRRLSDAFSPRRGDAHRETTVGQPAASARASLNLGSVSSAVWLWATAGIAVIAIFVILYLTLGSSHNAGPNYTARARTAAGRALTATSPSARSNDLAIAWKNIRLARKHQLAGKKIQNARNYVQGVSDTIYQIDRLKLSGLTSVANFNNSPKGKTELAGGSPALFLLSFGRKQLFVDASPTKQKTAVPWARPGDQFSQVFWHDPVALAASGNMLVALDTQYNLLTYTPGTSSQGTIQVLQPPASGTKVAAATTFATGYGTNFYILDSGTGQIWRYADLSATPSGYLNTPQANLLKSADSIAIDGNVYIGLRNGQVLKYVTGTTTLAAARFKMHLPFTLHHVNELYTSATLPYLFVLDRGAGRIIEVGKRGRYVRTLLVPRPLRRHLGQITVSSDGHTVYFVSGKRIYSVPVQG